ncbi:unnamed protein product, partial [Fusarium graminearum]
YRQKCHACQKEMSNSYFRVKADGLFDEAFEGADRSRSLYLLEYQHILSMIHLVSEPRNSSECGICSTTVKYA